MKKLNVGDRVKVIGVVNVSSEVLGTIKLINGKRAFIEMDVAVPAHYSDRDAGEDFMSTEGWTDIENLEYVGASDWKNIWDDNAE